jgi:hypothetical protein
MFQYEGRNRIYFGAQATLLDGDTFNREMASEWATKHIRLNPAHSWILGKFVEAEKANKNQQYFPLESLVGNPTVINSPMNVNHNPNRIIGSFVANEVIYPTGEEADDQPTNPFMETLAVFWKYYFPGVYADTQKAANEGGIFYSMECIPRAVATVGGADDSVEYPYQGRQHPTYPTELNERSVPMKLIDPHFVGGALVLPPENPAWSGADAKQVAKFMNDSWDQAEIAYEGIRAEAPHLEPKRWDSLMLELIAMEAEQEMGRNFSDVMREKMAKNGQAMSGGGYPIANVADLKNAIRAVGRAKNPEAVKTHIRARAKALGAEDLIPSEW